VDTKVQQLLDGQLDLSTLSGSELEKLQTTIGNEFKKLDKGAQTSAGDLEVMGHLADAKDLVATEITARADEAAETEASVSALRDRIAPQTAEREDEAHPDGTGTGPTRPDEDGEQAPSGPSSRPSVEEGEPAGDAGSPSPDKAFPRVPRSDPADDDDADADEAERQESIAASIRRPSRAALARRGDRPAAKRRPALVAGGALVAANDMPGLGLGTRVNWSQIAASTSRKLEMASGGAGQVLCASMLAEYPKARQLTDDPWRNADILDRDLSQRAIMNRLERVGSLDALVAAGGICEPVPVDYDIPVQAVADRPVRDMLPVYQATRGGLRFIQPPTFAGVGASGTAIWTAANDAAPSSPPTKPVQTFTCGTTIEELVDAIPTRLQFSNMQSRFSPEIVAANTELALANAARVAELNLLAKLSARSTIVGAPALLSFTRDFFALLELVAQGMRYRNRLPDMFPLNIVLPAWFKGAVRTDLLRELAHDRSGSDEDNLKVADAYVRSMFGVRGIVPSYVLDGMPKSVGGTTLGTNAWDWPDQGFAAPTALAAFAAPAADASATSASAGTYWPKRLSFFIFPAGTFVFLDGGRIDFGIIKDSALNATNQYQTFVEPFEGVAKRGYESIQMTVPVNMSGSSVGGVTAPTVPAAY